MTEDTKTALVILVILATWTAFVTTVFYCGVYIGRESCNDYRYARDNP